MFTHRVTLTEVGDLDLSLPAWKLALQVEAVDQTGQPATFLLRTADQQTEPSTTRYPLGPQDNPSDLIYSTFLGGNSLDEAFAIAVDGNCNANSHRNVQQYAHGDAGHAAPLPAAYTAAVDLRRAARGEKRAQNLAECIGGYV